MTTYVLNKVALPVQPDTKKALRGNKPAPKRTASEVANDSVARTSTWTYSGFLCEKIQEHLSPADRTADNR